MRRLMRWVKCIRGQNMVEYALILAFVGAIAVTVLSTKTFDAVKSAVDAAIDSIQSAG